MSESVGESAGLEVEELAFRASAKEAAGRGRRRRRFTKNVRRQACRRELLPNMVYETLNAATLLSPMKAEPLLQLAEPLLQW